jgi:hypothetical protein
MASFTGALNLRAMGFCGADDSASPEHLQLLSIHYPWIEWGILFRPDKEGTPRYATAAWVEKLCRINKETGNVMRLAGHLCGERCQQVLDGDAAFIKQLQEMGFGRVQVNATKANSVNVSPDKLEEIADQLRSCILEVPEIEWIFQLNNETRPLFDHLVEISFLEAQGLPPNISVLYDASCGLGVEADEYQEPLIISDQEVASGYAGGMGPHNIEDVLSKVARSSKGKKVWIDMESSLRTSVVPDKYSPDTPADTFSIDKCFKCVLAGSRNFPNSLQTSRISLLSI